jgi:hypothetical protein
MKEDKNFDQFFSLKKKISRTITRNLKYSYVSYEPVDPDKTAEDIIKLLERKGFIRTVKSITNKDLLKN